MNDKISCPKCGSEKISEISYGYPGDIEEYLQLVAEKKIYSGGCCSDDDSSVWHCNECEFQWGRKSEKIDSFDYDQGFNLDEVYDQ